MTLSRGQFIRLVLGIVLIGLLALVYLPRVFNTYSLSAVVSARTVQIVAPIPGVIDEELPLFGSELKRGESIGKITNNTVDKVKLEQLLIDSKYYTERIDASKAEVASLKKVFDEMGESQKVYIGSLLERAVLALRREEDRHQQLLAILYATYRENNRKEALVRKGFISHTEFDQAKARYNDAVQQVDQSEQGIRGLLAQVTSLKNGINVYPDGRTELSGQNQRMEDLRVRIIDIESRIKEYEVRVKNIQSVREAEEARVAKLGERKMESPVDGSVWRVFSAKGTFVEQNTPIMEILDCGNVFVDVSLPERLFEKIHPGQKAWVRLNGSSEDIEGKVTYIRGGALDPRVAGLMVGLPNVNRQREIQVLVKIDDEKLKQIKGDFCHVGRTGEVKFEGI